MKRHIEVGLVIVATIAAVIFLWGHYSRVPQCNDGIAFGDGANWKCIRSNGR